MARDPFAPVTQPSIPPWIWIIGGTFALLLVVMGATVFVVMSRRAVPPAVAAPAPSAAPAADKAPPPTATASAGAATAPDKEPEKADGLDKGDDKGDDKHRRSRRHRGGGKAEAVAAKGPAAPSAPSAPAPKRKSDMSQKEIDSLLGL